MWFWRRVTRKENLKNRINLKIRINGVKAPDTVAGNFMAPRGFHFFARKRFAMKKICIVLLTLMAAVGCDFLDRDSQLGGRRADITRKPASNGSSGGLPKNASIYITGIEYPEGYDWRVDSNYGSVPFNLVVFSGTKRVLTLPSSLGISPDPDMHRLSGGHLYTDYASGGETVVGKDGKELFRYTGSETLKGFMALSDGIYTLGQSRTGSGLSFRKDGVDLYSDHAGYVIGDTYTSRNGALYEDSGALCFCYYTVSSTGRTYYCVRDGQAEEVIAPEKIAKFYDLRVSDEKPVFLGDVVVSKKNYPAIFRDGDYFRLKPVGKFEARNYRFISSEGKYYVRGEKYSKNVLQGTSVWDSACAMLSTSDKETTALGIEVRGGRPYYVATTQNGYVRKFVAPTGTEGVSDSLMVMSGGCVALSGSSMYAAVTSCSDLTSPFLWIDGQRTSVLLNGYLSSIQVVKKK